MTDSFPLPRLQRYGNGSRNDYTTSPYDAEEMRQHIANALAAENWIVPPTAPSHLPAPEEVAHRLNMLETYLDIAMKRLERMDALKTRIEQIERVMGVDYERHA
jgi:hypothetical protein